MLDDYVYHADYPRCPFCETTFETNLEEKEDEEVSYENCLTCGKYFYVKKHIEVTFSSFKQEEAIF